MCKKLLVNATLCSIFIFHLLNPRLQAQDKIKYPEVFKSSQVDTIWGKPVADPYRWMENISSPEVESWLKAQKKLASAYSGKVTSLSEHLKLYGAIHFNPIHRVGSYYFESIYTKEEETPGLYYMKKIDGTPKLLFDPNRLAKKNIVAITSIGMSEDNNSLAIMLSENGSDWNSIRFVDMSNGRLMKDSLGFVKYSSINWYKDGIFYSKYPVASTQESFKTTISRTIYYHKLGTPQSEDKLFTDGNEELIFRGNFIIKKYSFFNNGEKIYAVACAQLNDSLHLNFKDFIITRQSDVDFDIIGSMQGKLLVQTDWHAPNGAIYKYDTSGINKAEVFIPQYAQQLNFSRVMQHKIISIYSSDSISTAVMRDTTGKILHEWQLPAYYSISLLSGAATDSIIVLGFNSFFIPTSVYTININTFEIKPLSPTEVYFNFEGLVTKKVYYKSKDGTAVPMYLTYKQGIKLNGNNPTILYGYGGFGEPMEPFFDVDNIPFLNNGGILAVPCLRGGGDFPGWHEKGMRLKKQNTFDDFIAAAEYLISNFYTNSDKLAAMGGSHGGLVVGAAITQRPDLFKVAVSESGVFDMLRYHLYNVGNDDLFVKEFGNIKDSLDFRNLLSYSPVQNVKPGVNYPATLLIAGDNDDRVNPFNSFKFLAELQAKGTGTNPYILYYHAKAGHLGNDLYGDTKDLEAFEYAFIFKYLGIEKSIHFNYKRDDDW